MGLGAYPVARLKTFAFSPDQLISSVAADPDRSSLLLGLRQSTVDARRAEATQDGSSDVENRDGAAR